MKTIEQGTVSHYTGYGLSTEMQLPDHSIRVTLTKAMKKGFVIWFLLSLAILHAGERVVFADNALSIEVPDGWKKSERNADATLAGWETSDATTSVFFQKMNVGRGIDMTEIMDDLVNNFDQNEHLIFHKAGEYKSGQVKGVNQKFPAIFTTLDVTFKAGPKDFEMKYYLFAFDTGDSQYFLQASSTKPVRGVREKQIMDLIRSIIAQTRP